MMTSLVTRAIAVFGVLLFAVARRSHAFVINGRPSLLQTAGGLHAVQNRVTPVSRAHQRVSKTRVDCVIDEYQENPEGLEEGDMVKVIAKGLRFYHIRKYKDEGYDPEGTIGKVTWLKLVSRKTGGLVTANRPVMVEFKNPTHKCHFEFGEVQKLSQEELDKFLEEAEAEAAAAAKIEAEAEAEAKRRGNAPDK